MAYKHITYEERQVIEKMYKSDESIWDIAKALGRSYITVQRELNRCPEGMYTADTAQHDRNCKIQTTVKAAHEEDAARAVARYKKQIRTCLVVNPDADISIIAKATKMPIERVEKYYDEVRKSI